MPTQISLGSLVQVEVTPAKDGDLLALHLDFKTPFGVLRNTTYAHANTLRALIVWLRGKYGTMAYDFVTRR